LINIYSSPTCSKCKALKVYCLDRNIIFNEINISTNKEALQKLKDKALMNLPVIENTNTDEIYSFYILSASKEIIRNWEENKLV
jgi:arsenate reductase-like glutaredoxin family protein